MQSLEIEVPTSCVQYKRFINLANEYTNLPNISYYILLHTAMQCISIEQVFSTKIISYLEQNKPSVPDLDQKKTGEQMEQQAIGLFTLSVKQDEIQPTAITAKQYLNASVLLECLSVFENIENIEKYKEMAKFSKFRSRTILSDLKTKGTSEPFKSESNTIDSSIIQPSAPVMMDFTAQPVTQVEPQDEPISSPKIQQIEKKPVKSPATHKHVPVYDPVISNVKMSSTYVEDQREIQKLCKHISSAVEYDDLVTCEKLLTKALELVNRHQK
eukprot:NODE_641_length_5642_cov_0.330507.p2 type:complete len:271 gc:universal NODE_641_length_5642_cov_0.330507:1218-406(-)